MDKTSEQLIEDLAIIGRLAAILSKGKPVQRSISRYFGIREAAVSRWKKRGIPAAKMREIKASVKLRKALLTSF